MEHADHLRLIKDAIPKGGVWADLGSGRGAFTRALAESVGAEGEIYSIDTDRRDLETQEIRISTEHPEAKVTYKQGDFTRPLDLPPLDGILMANSLHFIHDKKPVLERLIKLLKEDGRLVLVEYDTNEGNTYVPYPLTFAQWVELAKESGFAKTDLLTTHPSSFLGRFYSAVSYKQAPEKA